MDALPELNALVAACWNQRDLRRPTAAELQEALEALLSNATDQPQLSWLSHDEPASAGSGGGRGGDEIGDDARASARQNGHRDY
jgi:hypothetical protein